LIPAAAEQSFFMPYFKIQFSAVNFVPNGELHPCSDLEGVHARVEYVESLSKEPGVIVSVEMNK
jgi:hypothetical protein